MNPLDSVLLTANLKKIRMFNYKVITMTQLYKVHLSK